MPTKTIKHNRLSGATHILCSGLDADSEMTSPGQILRLCICSTRVFYESAWRGRERTNLCSATAFNYGTQTVECGIKAINPGHGYWMPDARNANETEYQRGIG